MITVLAVSIIALFFANLESFRNYKNGLKVAFIIITILSCLRYDFGNDYMGYMREFFSNDKYSIDYILFSDSFKDKFWFILQKFIRPLGWFLFAALISVFCNIIYYNLIKIYVQRKYYWLSFFIYVFTFDMFVLQQSMIRQGLAIAVMAWVYMLIDKFQKKNFILIIIALAFAISIHKSAAIVLPFLLLKFLPLKNTKVLPSLLIGFFIIAFSAGRFLESTIYDLLMLEIFSTYALDYGLEDGVGIGIRAIIEFIPFFVGIYYLGLKRTLNGPRFIIVMSTMATILFPLTTVIHLISRIIFYFGILYIVSIPITYSEIKNKLIRYSLLTLFIVTQLYVYFDRFSHPVYQKAFSEYHTIFSAF